MSFAADDEAVSVLCGAVVLAGVALVAATSLLKAVDQERSVLQHERSHTQRHRCTVPSPGDADRPLPFYLTVQHQGAVPHGDDITGFFDER